jgi:DNA-directed RNA polymerase specialized sigma subunit
MLMSKTGKKRANKEIAALAALKDADIDTSDIPEVKDWSAAIEGRFYRPKRQSILHLEENSRQMGKAVDARRTTYTQMTTRQLIAEFSQGIIEARQEIIRRCRGTMASVVTRMADQAGNPSPEVIEDLIEEACRRLAADNYRTLKAVSVPDANSDYILVMAMRVAASVAKSVTLDYFSTVNAHRGDSATDLSLIRKTLEKALESVRFPHEFEQVDRVLKTIASEQESAIFWLHCRQGRTAKEIAYLLGTNLTDKDVEKILSRLLSQVESKLKGIPSESSRRPIK